MAIDRSHSHGSSDDMPSLVDDLADEQGPHDRKDVGPRYRPPGDLETRVASAFPLYAIEQQWT